MIAAAAPVKAANPHSRPTNLSDVRSCLFSDKTPGAPVKAKKRVVTSTLMSACRLFHDVGAPGAPRKRKAPLLNRNLSSVVQTLAF